MFILRVLIGIFWLIWLVYWILSSFYAKRSIRNNNWLIGLLIRIVIIFLILLFLHVPILYHIFIVLHTASMYTNPLVACSGFLLFLLGLALSLWARVTLGRNWGMPMTEKEKPELVTKGPYSCIRHPIYTGVILAMLGTTITETIFWIIPFVIVTSYFIYCSKREERDMLRKFPKEYMEYKKRTKALLPFVY